MTWKCNHYYHYKLQPTAIYTTKFPGGEHLTDWKQCCTTHYWSVTQCPPCTTLSQASSSAGFNSQRVSGSKGAWEKETYVPSVGWGSWDARWGSPWPRKSCQGRWPRRSLVHSLRTLVAWAGRRKFKVGQSKANPTTQKVTDAKTNTWFSRLLIPRQSTTTTLKIKNTRNKGK